MGPLEWALIQYDRCPYRKRRDDRDAQSQRTTIGIGGKRMATCKPRTEAFGETKPADTLMLDFQPLEM